MRRVKVVNIVAKLDRGGAEVFLKDVVEFIDKTQYELTFLMTKAEPGYFDNHFKKMGINIHKLKKRNNKLDLISLYKYFRKNKFSVVHCHLLNFSGIILFIAWLAGVSIRVSHSHSDKSELNSKASFSRRIYLKVTKVLLNRFSTHKIACSISAGKSLFGNNDFILIENGVNLSKFSKSARRDDLRFKYREEFSLNFNTKIIGHVGRYNTPKNHKFLIKVAKSLIKLRTDFKVILVGEGTLYGDIKSEIINEDLQEFVLQIGGRDDVPELMMNIFDVFLFPSIYEGMPIALIEAQSANLYSLISSSVPNDVVKIPELFSILNLSLGADVWARELDNIMDKQVEINNARDIIKNSDLNVEVSAAKIMDVYNSLSV